MIDGGEPTVIIVCGVAGSGKSTVAGLLAVQSHWTYLDADSLHTQSSIQQMRRGHGLSDEQREPWLLSVRDQIDQGLRDGISHVVACSALKRSHRELLRSHALNPFFVQLLLAQSRITDRLGGRLDHFAGADLLQSQLIDFEPLHDDELGIQLNADRAPASILMSLHAALNEYRTSESRRTGIFHS